MKRLGDTHLNGPSSRGLRGILLCKGLTLTDFAQKHGFRTNTVVQVVKRYWGRPYRPRGVLSLQVLDALKEEIKHVQR